MSTHVTGPVLMGDEAEPHRFVADLYKADSSVLKAAGVAKLWLHGNLALTLVDRKASFVAADAKKQVEMLKVRKHGRNMRRARCCGDRARELTSHLSLRTHRSCGSTCTSQS